MSRLRPSSVRRRRWLPTCHGPHMNINSVSKLILLVWCSTVEDRVRAFCQFAIDVIRCRTTEEKRRAEFLTVSGRNNGYIEAVLIGLSHFDIPISVTQRAD